MSMKIALLALKTPSSKLLSLNGYRFGKICFDASFKCVANERATFTLLYVFLVHAQTIPQATQTLYENSLQSQFLCSQLEI